ncbi:hypothetical protein SAMN02745165_01909 [Malonomonas rubra DSM 5091]|uniref:Uncharacterized protein n=1 Tax=Malonomonas rubra DSM 5091 TaxID=1122189 RepID=A0A1M6HPJ0_MALRU|nr:hypothetical protein [Malonomonas rubra]SHJ24137.1 hypothetical protein SAMN02745165_01909 [Malonomonas rubra DSM 5091]
MGNVIDFPSIEQRTREMAAELASGDPEFASNFSEACSSICRLAVEANRIEIELNLSTDSDSICENIDVLKDAVRKSLKDSYGKFICRLLDLLLEEKVDNCRLLSALNSE